MKKILTLLLLTLILFSVACGAESDQPETTDAVKEEAIDLEGAVFLFAPWSVDAYFPLVATTDSGDKMLARYAALEEDYNCSFVPIDTYNERYNASDIINRIASGTGIPDLIDREVDAAYSLYKSGVLAALDDMPAVNLSEQKWGPEFFRQHGKFGGLTYGFFPYEWEWMPEIKGIIAVNNLLINQLTMANPYELQEKGQWEWNNYKEQLKIGTVTEGENKYVGMIVCNGGDIPVDYMETAAYSNGALMVINKDGKAVFGLNTSEAIEGLDYAASLYTEKLAKSATEQNFINYGSPYYFTRSYQITSRGEGYMGTILEEYGLMPFPDGPSAPEGNYSSYISYDRLLYPLSVSNNNPEDIGKVLNYLFEPLDDKGGWKTMSERQIFHHKEDYNNFVSMVENCGYNYQVLLGDMYSKDFKSTINKVITGKETSAAAMTSLEDAMNVKITEMEIITVKQSITVKQ